MWRKAYEKMKWKTVIQTMFPVEENSRKTIILAAAEGIAEIMVYYVPLFIMSYFLEAFMANAGSEIFFYGALYFTVICVLGVMKRRLQGERVAEGRKRNEQFINRIYEKIQRISYEDCMDFQVRQKYMTALDVFYYDFDYSDMLEQLIIIFSEMGKVIVSITMTAALIMAVPAGTGGIMQILAEPWLCGGIFAALLLVLTAVILCLDRRKTEKSRQLLERHAAVENKIGYLKNRIVYFFSEYLTFHIFGMEDMLKSRFEENQAENVSYYMTNRDDQIKKNFRVNLVVGAAVLYAAFLVVVKTLSGAAAPHLFITYLGGIVTLQACVFHAVEAYGRIADNVNYFEIAREVMGLPEEKGGGRKPEGVIPESITFEHVCYRYPNMEEDTIKDISFTIEKGKRHALVGVNGSGKTTLLLLLCRVLNPDSGTIRLNGVDIKEYDIGDYRRIFSYVFQDGGIYPILSVGENVALRENYDADLVEKELRFCGMNEKLCTKETILAQDNCKYSGGEKQKMLAARAFYRKSPVYVFDEPTSAMDAISEGKFYQKLLEAGKNHFVLFVSHRMSSCMECEDILVLDDGRLAERGTHEDLLKQNGIYERLWTIQAASYKKQTV